MENIYHCYNCGVLIKEDIDKIDKFNFPFAEESVFCKKCDKENTSLFAPKDNQ